MFGKKFWLIWNWTRMLRKTWSCLPEIRSELRCMFCSALLVFRYHQTNYNSTTPITQTLHTHTHTKFNILLSASILDFSVWWQWTLMKSIKKIYPSKSPCICTLQWVWLPVTSHTNFFRVFKSLHKRCLFATFCLAQLVSSLVSFRLSWLTPTVLYTCCPPLLHHKSLDYL